MKTNIRCIGFNIHATWQDLVMEQLHQLKNLAAIESADVILELQRDNAPAYRARVVLVVPGPDFHAEAADFTLSAALHKVVDNLIKQIRIRQANRRINGKSKLQLGTISRRWTGACAGRL